MTSPSRYLVLPLLAVLAGCASMNSRRAADPGEGGGVENRDGAVVISGAALEDGSGTVLAALQGKVPSMRIQRHPDRCPEVTLRSATSYRSIPNPHIYVDGIRATDTCILEQLRSQDVASIEIYPLGVTKRPGYGMNANGLILIFMRSA